MEKELVKCKPYIADDGIYVPVYDYQYKGDRQLSKLLISKELFVEAYNRWIKDGGNHGTNSV